ncbi:MAG: hypothetical protein AAF798_09780 [Bacteroidota bacterium]
MEPIRAAFLYATAEDQQYCTNLRQFIAPLERSGLLEIEEFDIHETELSRQDASRFDLFFCLMSPAFLYFFFDTRDDSQDLTYLFRDKQVIPVLMRPSLWKSTEFGQLQPLPKKGTISSMANPDQGFLAIAEGIKELAEELQYQKIANQQDVEDYQIIQLLHQEAEFYEIVDETSAIFDERYKDFIANEYYWNYFARRFGYSISRYTRQELEDIILRAEGIYIREISIEEDISTILDYIEELHGEFSSTNFECCLVIYNKQSAFYNDYQDYKNSFSKFYGKFVAIQEQSRKYRFNGKLIIAYNVFSKPEICEQV